MAENTEPRALTAALQGPAFATKAGGLAMHVANRHVERWAPEADATRVRSMRSLGFVDRLVTPWLETAQRSAGLRMFSQYTSGASIERPASQTSWVFPRPWYQDELDWMAAARQVQAQQAVQPQAAPALFTTRGTYVPRAEAPVTAIPAAVYEYVAPSLSVAQPAVAGGSADAYSPLVPLAAASAAQLMSRAIAPLSAPAQMSPGLRTVLATMLERSTRQEPAGATRLAGMAPELVTPPAPRPEERAAATESFEAMPAAAQIAERYAHQRAQIAELERVARVAAQKELAARAEAAQPHVAPAAQTSSITAERRTVETTAERQRIEERIRERLAERQVQAQRLHDQARDAAARDARVAAATPTTTVATTTLPTPAAAAPAVPAEIAAAMAALPAELTGYIGRRPDRAIQAIAELGDALRTVELLARNAASGGAIEPTRGPRLVMPAGLGGLVATVDRAMPASALFASGERATAEMPAAATPTAPRTMRAPSAAMRVPAPTWLAAPGRANVPTTIGATSALGAATSQAPNAIQHVAWADRWLARFAGARSESLDVLSATAARPELRLSALAAAAPDGVFVAPSYFDIDRAPAAEGSAALRPDVRLARAESVVRGAEPVRAAEPVRIDDAAARTPVLRIDDSAETPDELFAAISASASRARTRAPAAASEAGAAAPSVTSAATTAPDRATFADLVAHSAPSAPGAGMSAQLASSPFAPALRHLLPLGAAPAFDVRALFGGNLSATFLAGLLAPATRELAIGPDALPIAAWGEPSITTTGELTREVPGFDATYVSPVESAPESAATDVAAFDVGAPATRADVRAAQVQPVLTTLRTALLSWDVETAAAAASGSPVPASATAAASDATFASPFATSARTILESLSLPMVGETAATSAAEPAWTMPGMTAERAQSWSVAQERSSADLSFDFVPPELVLAARVYGLGPAEAAQAMRLAIAGPGGLTAMATTVDRAFVQALALEAERREGGARGFEQPITAFPTTRSSDLAARATDSMGDLVRPEARSPKSEVPSAQAPSASTFGVDRRAPRGSFLWPSATVGALGIQAAAPDGEQSMSVAAIELLAARAVAELGTFAALGERIPGMPGVQTDGTVSAAAGTTLTPATAGAVEEREVLASATSLVPASRRSKFEALYLAVSRSSAGQQLSPAARAARALALAGRGEETITARERAAIAWDVLPHVQVGGEPVAEEPLSTGAAASRETQRRALAASAPSFELPILDRPGLGSLSGRAGEALGSYVTPPASSAPAAGASSSRDSQGAVMRAPTAAQELVRTGRPSSRAGGGEVEIPPWFEAAARKMLEERSGSSDGISLAELTLVSAAPSNAIAAATRGVPSATSSTPSANGKQGEGASSKELDVERIANEVYQQILVLMDAARARNGEPYL